MADTFDFEHAFPVPIFRHSRLDGFAKHQQGLIDLIRRLRQEDKGIRRSNQLGWHSDYSLHELPDPHIKWLTSKLLEITRKSIESLGKGKSTQNLRVTQLWGNLSEAGAYNITHNHHLHTWAGVFYLLAEASCEESNKDDRGGMLEMLCPFPYGEQQGIANSMLYRPKDGTVVMFPGFLNHFVHPHRTPHMRISMAFNIDV